MIFRQLYEPETSTYTYLLADPKTREAVLIDPVREKLERDRKLLEELDLTLVYALDTHVHADHVTAAGMLREQLGSKTVVSNKGGAPCADVPVTEGDKLFFGDRWLEVRETPGHTDGCVSYLLDDQTKVFTGDTLLIRGTGRTDFQQGDPARLYDSIQAKLFSLPDDTEVYPGHDYRGFRSSTIGEEKQHNPRIGGRRSKQEFVEIMSGLQLAQPKRIAEAVPANLACGLDGAPSDANAKGSATQPAPAVVEPPLKIPVVRAGAVPEIDASWLAEHPQVRLVDVRGLDEWNEGHIAGAELAPLPTLEAAAREWSREAPTVVVCRVGGRSAMGALTLEGLGFTNVASLRGGVLAWVAGGRKLTR